MTWYMGLIVKLQCLRGTGHEAQRLILPAGSHHSPRLAAPTTGPLHGAHPATPWREGSAPFLHLGPTQSPPQGGPGLIYWLPGTDCLLTSCCLFADLCSSGRGPNRHRRETFFPGCSLPSPAETPSPLDNISELSWEPQALNWLPHLGYGSRLTRI